MTAQNLIRDLQLLPHPKGGYYRETYRSAQTLTTAEGTTRHVSTAIYYLLVFDPDGKIQKSYTQVLGYN